MSKKLRDLINAEAEAAEAAEADQTDRSLPPHVKVSRPGHARSKVLQVRLNPEELESLERIALRRELPVSTIARAQLLQLIAGDQLASPGGLEHLRERLMDAADIVVEVAETIITANVNSEGMSSTSPGSVR